MKQHCAYQGDMYAISCSDSISSSSSDDLPKAARGIDAFQQDLLERCKLLAKGVYGLPEAIADIQSLKTKLAALSEDRAGTLVDSSTCAFLRCVLSLTIIAACMCHTGACESFS